MSMEQNTQKDGPQLSEKADASVPVDEAAVEREKTKAFLAKWSLSFLFVGVVLSAAFGFLLEQPEAYALTAGFGAAAMLILNHYFRDSGGKA